MEDYKKEIVHSQAIKAGKRIYYVDVKKSRKDDMYIAITESKKIATGEGVDEKVNFEKHKIFLYKEDFEKFLGGLTQAINFIEERQGNHNQRPAASGEENGEAASVAGEEIKLDIEF